MSAWTDELKEEVIQRYEEELAAFSTDEEKASRSVEVVQNLSEEFDKTPNGVRMVLVKANVYVKAQKTAKPTTSTGTTKRINKAEAQQELKNAIALIDSDLIDEDIIERTTGKAAQYFTEVIQKAITTGE